MEIIIRKERKEEYHQTEEMVMQAFWNMHGSGCNEHLLVHRLRQSEDYLESLSRVAEVDGKIVGAIFYSKAWIEHEGKRKEILTFGPLCADPLYQNCGVCGKLLAETIELARVAGYPGICIFGEPDYYPKHGFITADHFGLMDAEGHNFPAFMGYELQSGGLSEMPGRFTESKVFEECPSDQTEEGRKALATFNKKFPPYKPLKFLCQWLHTERLGRISEVQKNSYVIRYWGKEIPAKLSGRFYREETELPVVGDYVTFCYNPKGDSKIVEICERKNFLTRPDTAKSMKEQPMAANIDYAFLVMSLNDNFNRNRVVRYAATVLQEGVQPIIILTKADLCSDVENLKEQLIEMLPQIKVHAVSALTGEGMDALNVYLQSGNTIALLGSSGVGKSTLVNALAGTEVMKTGEIREKDAKGRHTTTYREMIELPNGVIVIDTPGMREIGICDVDEGIDDTFEDIAELAMQCRFRDCTHTNEPRCAVRQALEDGRLSQERFDLYRSLHDESRKSADMKAIAKARKQLNRSKKQR